MQRNKFKYPFSKYFLNKLLKYSETFEYASFLLSNDVKDAYSVFNNIVALGSIDVLQSNSESFKKLNDFHNLKKDWLFGFLSYDLKNETEELLSENIDNFNSPNLYFYLPKYVFIFEESNIIIETFSEKTEIDKLISDIKAQNEIPDLVSNVELDFRETKEQYLSKIKSIKNHIQKGDIYEMNYCQELYSEEQSIKPTEVFWELNKKSKSPFSVFSKIKSDYLLCSSPERFLQKKGQKITSQPIKGTRKRGESNKEDLQLILELETSKKDISENVMITDLVRNDLSVTAKKSSVEVEELCKVYTFESVHQMISTISSELDENYNFVDVLKSCFPMGSMTGAPKIKSMELIERYETTKRSLFSAAFGYITPNEDFDFNVVIRSILYNDINKNISVMVGGAITINSDPEDEYQESLVKAKAMMQVLKNEK